MLGVTMKQQPGYSDYVESDALARVFAEGLL
jgi:hypothetical protein